MVVWIIFIMLNFQHIILLVINQIIYLSINQLNFRINLSRKTMINGYQKQIKLMKSQMKMRFCIRRILQHYLLFLFYRSHKKRKDSLETRAELAIPCSYVENQAILEPILLYWASKCKQTKEQGSEDCL